MRSVCMYNVCIYNRYLEKRESEYMKLQEGRLMEYITPTTKQKGH